MSFADIMDFAGDYSGKKKLQNQRDLAAEDGRADNLYDDSDQFFRGDSTDQPLGAEPRSSVKAPLEPLMSPFSAPFRDEEDSPAPVSADTAPAMAQDRASELAPLIGDGRSESMPASPAAASAPAPRKRGFFSRIGSGLKRMWSGFRSLFRKKPNRVDWNYVAPPEPRPDQWFLDDRPRVEQELIAQATAPKPEDVVDPDDPAQSVPFGYPMSRPASRNPDMRDRTGEKHRRRLDKDKAGNRLSGTWYKQDVVDQIAKYKVDKSVTSAQAARTWQDSVDSQSPMLSDIATSYGRFGYGLGHEKALKRAQFFAPPEATDADTAAQHGLEHLPGRYGQLNLINEQFFQKLGKDLPRRFREDGAAGNPLFDTALGRSGAWRRLSM